MAACLERLSAVRQRIYKHMYNYMMRTEKWNMITREQMEAEMVQLD
jgi:hypothetical protein